MKVIFLSTNGRAYAEDCATGTSLVEEPDGVHPLNSTNIWRNDEARVSSWGPDDAIALVWHGVGPPDSYGAVPDAKQQMVDDFIHKLFGDKQSISKQFWRNIVGMLLTGAMLFIAVSLAVVCALLTIAVVVIFV